MPNKTNGIEENSTEKRPASIEEAGNGHRSATAVAAAPPWSLITIGVVATIVFVAIIICGWSIVALHHQTREIGRRGGLSSQYNDQNNDGSGGYAYGGGGYRRGSSGGALGSAAARGVITSINGDTLVVSGEGKQVTVKKSSSTTIGGDKSDVAVNDTVVVYGTTESDGSVDASQISVRNQASSSMAPGQSDMATPDA